ncbi:DNA cytosine methyltransferase [Treponema denticola]|uniref:DNA cytosine methyltransferase n=1 Tax=Treponema denticola TaxID=158 RepID=UPI0020A34B2D|nr:DNA (cytosine-5-)-methyltransferase [Treponema denticola]UTC82708.1 DNA cytosine methyltransferase [Treponema denticola]
MTYLSVCSGIEAATVAWEPLGFKPVGFAEIEPFPCELLKQKYQNVRNYGDITQYENWNIEQFDILVGGTPCQSFSIAGKRGGTDDERGALMYAYLGIVEACRPRWIVWENVSGVLSSNSGYDFASFLAGLEECGYGWAYRVLDAQYFGVPQRRRRVFVVGHSDNRTDLVAKVLFEQEKPRTSFEASEGKTKEITGTLTTGFGARGFDCDTILNNQFAVESYTQSSFAQYKEGVGTLKASGGDFGGGSETIIKEGRNIRRLTPLECERLQGFPDNYTQIEWKGKPKDQCPDSHRYKAIGNSMAVPVMRWIGERIKRIKGVKKE